VTVSPHIFKSLLPKGDVCLSAQCNLACIWLYRPPLQCDFVPLIAWFSVVLAGIQARSVGKNEVSNNTSACLFSPFCSALELRKKIQSGTRVLKVHQE
uniref:Uncharacterized protein n=1 Tax=Bubo bubo TaxID=30461 RepID=A0A8C0ETF9_BUBBB